MNYKKTTIKNKKKKRNEIICNELIGRGSNA